MLQELGRGAGGVVFKALHLPTLRVVAIKRVRMSDPEKQAQIMREANSLMSNYQPVDELGGCAPCPYIISFHGAFTDAATRTVSLILEFMDGGVLQEFVDEGVPCNEPLLAAIAYRMLKGLEHVHGARCIHRDVKPQNVLMNSAGELKISDMGITKELNGGINAADTFTGTVMYMSPERLEGKSYSYDSDVWSLGLTLVTLANAKMPFDTTDGFWGLAARLRDGPMPSLDTTRFSPEIRDFVSRCLQRDPDIRASVAELLTHPWILRYATDKGKHRGDPCAENDSNCEPRNLDLGSTCIRRRLTNSVSRDKDSAQQTPEWSTSSMLQKFKSFEDRTNGHSGHKTQLAEANARKSEKAFNMLRDAASKVTAAWKKRGENVPNYQKSSIVKLALLCGMSESMATEKAVKLWEEGLKLNPESHQDATFTPR
jgi:serine/threonine protein kinase